MRGRVNMLAKPGPPSYMLLGRNTPTASITATTCTGSPKTSSQKGIGWKLLPAIHDLAIPLDECRGLCIGVYLVHVYSDETEVLRQI